MAKLTCLIIELRPWSDQDLVDTTAAYSTCEFLLKAQPLLPGFAFLQGALDMPYICVYIFISCIYIFKYSQ